MNNYQKSINQIEEKIKIAQSNIQTWETNLERYRNYLKELTDQLLTVKLEIKKNIK